ncbi:MAG TPA: outer membrane beta-barrel protein [Blastocatellia bacterium]
MTLKIAEYAAAIAFVLGLCVLATEAKQAAAGSPQSSSSSASSPAVQQPAADSTEPPRRALPAPLDGVFPSSDYPGPGRLIGVPDTDPIYPLTKALWDASPTLKKAKIKVYGWIDGGFSTSTSKNSNIPSTYPIVPNKPEIDQAVIRFDREPDTVQTDHVDWGFRLTVLYGIDYRWTTAQGWFSEQLLQHNSLYGADPIEAYGLLYVPGVAQGMVLKVGRYLSPPDIETQTAPDNFLFTHSLMFTYDCFTQTGINAQIKLNDRWSILGGIHAGDDSAPWNESQHPTALLLARWVSKSNNDSIFGGIDSVNDGHFKDDHDNLQQFNLTWSHRLNSTGTVVTMTEAYYIYQSRALVGGTVIFGPARPVFEQTGPGAPIPGNAPAVGLVNYLAIKLSNHDFVTLRPLDILVDVKGERTGFGTTMESWSAGWTHRFGELISIRPEIRKDYAYSASPWDNGTRNSQLMFAMDAIIRY